MNSILLKQDPSHIIHEPIKDSISSLHQLINNKVKLKRPVFFIPGWNDDNCRCWAASNKGNIPLKDWLRSMVTNFQDAYFVNFQAESTRCDSFLAFGELIKRKIWAIAGKGQECDVVAHHMGGLGVRAAIALGEPLDHVQSCITIATPHRGEVRNGGKVLFGKMRGTYAGSGPSQNLQASSLHPDSESIKTINSVHNRFLFLDRVRRFYQIAKARGKGAARPNILEKDGVENLYQSKAHEISIQDDGRSSSIPLTLDPRAILAVIDILIL